MRRPPDPSMQPDRERLPLWFLLGGWLIVSAAFVLGLLVGQRDRTPLPEPQATALRLVLRQVEQSHVDEHRLGELLDRALRGMVSSLDEYSEYVAADEVAHFDENTTGTYEGIGVVSLVHDGELLVHFPLPGGPAERAGLEPGDCIVAVDGSAVADWPAAQRSDQANQRLRGPAGEPVRVSVRRGAEPPFAVELVRGPIQKPSVRWTRLLDAEHGLGYTRIGDFHRTTASELQQAILDLQQQCPHGLRGLIVDLRWNGGGLLDQCVGVARLFVAAGNIVTTRHRGDIVAEQTFDAVPEQCRYPELPLVLLVNGGTASASEVVTGALQDHGRAAVVGSRTYGKGVINTIYTWRNQPFRLKLTTARYFTPKGRNLDKPHDAAHRDQPGGIVPDREVELPLELQRQVLQRLEGYEVPARFRAAVRELDQRIGRPHADLPGADVDLQLAAALDELLQRLPATTAAGNGR